MSKPNVAVTRSDDEVIIHFDKPVTHIGLNPENALKFIEAIHAQIEVLSKRSGSRIILPTIN